jgi:hypothetical protein
VPDGAQLAADRCRAGSALRHGGDEPGITIEATTKGPYVEDVSTEWEWGRWLVNTFPPDVYRHFAMLEVYETDDAR